MEFMVTLVEDALSRVQWSLDVQFHFLSMDFRFFQWGINEANGNRTSYSSFFS